MRWIWTVTVLGVLAACGGGGAEDNAAFCDAVERFPQVIEQSQRSPDDMDELEDQLAAIEGISTELISSAPGSVETEVAVIFETDSDSVRASEQEDLTEARETVNDYIQEECDLTITL